MSACQNAESTGFFASLGNFSCFPRLAYGDSNDEDGSPADRPAEDESPDEVGFTGCILYLKIMKWY